MVSPVGGFRSRFTRQHGSYSGVFPCFFGGFLPRLLSSMASAWVAALFTKHLKEIRERVAGRMPVFVVSYPKLVSEPMSVAEAVREFLGINLDARAMAAQADPGLYRNRK